MWLIALYILVVSPILVLPMMLSTEWEFRICRAIYTPLVSATPLFYKDTPIPTKIGMIFLIFIAMWIVMTMAIKFEAVQKEDNIKLNQLKLPF